MDVGVQGKLQLAFGYDDNDNRTCLEKQFFQPPLHLGKSYWDGEYCCVFLMSPTAGLLSGDRLSSQLNLASGSQVVLASPAASRVHTMCGEGAQLEQQIQIASATFLEVIPESLVLQKGAQLSQITTLHVDTGGELLFWEVLFPGRLFRGEYFVFNYFRNQFFLYYQKKLIALERYQIEAKGSKKDCGWEHFAKQSVYGSLYLVTEKKNPKFVEDLHKLQEKNLWIGVSPLCAGGYSIKILSESPVTFRKVQKKIRTLAYKLLGRTEPMLRC